MSRHYEGRGTIDVVKPMVLPSCAGGRGGTRVYIDRRKRFFKAVLGHSCTLSYRYRQAWGQRSVHRSTKTASRRRFVASVYTVTMRAIA